MDAIKSQTLREFAHANGITTISNVRLSKENGYPFVTFLTNKKDAEGKTVAINLFIAKSQADRFEEGDEISDDLCKQMVVVETTNAQGESRQKLAVSGSEYRTINW